jgi:3-dehydroquinate dehydratase/shikimate dehydrogenase
MDTQTQIASHLLRARLGKLCVALTAATPDELCDKATAALRETTFLEFRLDYLPKPLAALPALKKWLLAHGDATVIATCRCKGNGGRFAGSSTAELEVLLHAAEAGFPIVDLELESAEKLPKNTVEKLRAAGAAVIVSWHDFNSTPKDLEPIYKRMAPFAPDFMKVVSTAKSLSDNLTLMKFLGSAGDRTNSGIVGICMGEAGIISRVLGLRAGSAFTFAAASAGEETAPGQVAARTLIETYRIDQVDAATKVYGVAGNPIGHSLSPVMMNTAFRRETVNAVYLALQTSKADDLFRLMREVPIQGLSVTMPLKQDVIPHLERTDALSQKIGAVNTIARMPDGKFYGFNTDVAGIIGPLERRLSLRGAKVLVLGAGGAARAAVFGCIDKGAEVSILNRTPETAQKLARQSGAKAIKRDQLTKLSFDVIINCTPAGMAGNKTAAVLAPNELNARLVFDTVYNPIDTPLLRMARQKGLPVITGVEMFVTQGARQFEIWTGKPAPDQEMLRVVIHALRHGAEAASDSIDPTANVSKVITASAAEAAAAAKAAAEAATAAAAVPTPPPAPRVAAPVPAKKPVPAKPAPEPTKPEPAKKSVAVKTPAPTPTKKAATPKKAAPAKKTVPAKKAVPVKKAAPAKKPTPAPKKSAPAKKAAKTAKPIAAKKKTVPAKKVAAKKPAPKKAAPAKKLAAKKKTRR